MTKINFATAKPRDVEAYLREQVRKIFGDAVENQTGIHSSHGYYTCGSTTGKNDFNFSNFRKTDVPKIVKAMRALK